MSTAHSPASGFAPICDKRARLLILGSLPGERSIRDLQYYAHPRNAFWGIMRDVFGCVGSYKKRCGILRENSVALWDVLASAPRAGSLDSRIDLEHAVPNDFATLLSRCSKIETIGFNGRAAQKLFRRFVLPSLSRDYRYVTLPSTSPAHAVMSAAEKSSVWQQRLVAGGGQ